jgi:uncharacterized protein (TIGR02145 family)
MTTVQRNALAPVTSLLIYNTTTDCLEMYSATGAWVSIGCGCQLPGAFAASAATGATSTAFTTNWGASAGATGYFIDISTASNFSTFVTGYNNLSVGNVTSFAVSSNIACGTTYYYRLRANNTCGTSANSNTITAATTGCGVTCGTQVFAAANLNVGTEVNGGVTQTAGQKWCYGDLPANCTTYGAFYQWATVMGGSYSNTALSPPTINCDPCGTGGVQGICPSGYHVPTDLEWSRYEYCIENTIAPTGTTPLSTFQTSTGFRGSTTSMVGPGDKMKVPSSYSPPWNGTNTSGFTMLAAGDYNGTWTNQVIGAGNTNGVAYFWSATEGTATASYYREISYLDVNSFRNDALNKADGFSLRCLSN